RYLIEKWRNTPKAIVGVDISKVLYLLESALNLIIIYYLSPLAISLIGSSLWLIVFFYMFYASVIAGVAGYSFGQRYINSYFYKSSFFN
ncbi:MAG: hypothetical protein AABX35_00965, partial [Nanoarchaeota archaeon]